MQKIYFNKQNLGSTSISVFDPPISNITVKEDFDLLSIYGLITEGLKTQTNKLRSIIDLKEANDYKKSNLPYCTFSGSFSSRKDGALENHSNLICLDLDNLSPTRLRIIKKHIRTEANFIMCFVSPSGNGLKIVYPIDVNIATHDEWYQAYMNHLQQTCSLAGSYIDNSCKNVSRACFLANDPDAFLNSIIEQGGTVYPIDLYTTGNSQISEESENPNFTEIENFFINVDIANPNTLENFNALCTRTELKSGAYKSPREPWIFSLACRCNYLGMDKDKCLEYIYKRFLNHPESIRKDNPIDVKKYLLDPVHSAYKQYKNQFAKWEEVETSSEPEVIESPPTKLFSKEIYQSIPKFLQELCTPFDGREKDVFFMGLLGALSSCFNNVRGNYDGSSVRSNLFVLVTAPASAGKSHMKWAQKLIKPIHDEIKKNGEEVVKAYNREMEQYKNDPSNLHPGERPKSPILIIPANISSASFLQTIDNNDGVGLIFETEADTLSGAIGQDWGNFSDVLRKVFHHETISYKRKTNNEYAEISDAAFSIVLSGTPQQVFNLIPNTENGLFSRFCFYSFDIDPKWKDVWVNSKRGLEQIIDKQSKMLLEYYHWMKREETITFTFNEKQQGQFNLELEKYHNDTYELIGSEMLPTARRLGLITFRIAMILGIFRQIENDWTTLDVINCSDEDFNAALAIAEVLHNHALDVYQSFKPSSSSFKQRPQEFLRALPKEFNRQESVRVAESIGIKPKTAEFYIGKFIDKGALIRAQQNHYQKI